MAAEFLARGQRLLEIYAGAFLQGAAVCAEGSLANGFAGEVGREAVLFSGDDGQAAAVHRDAVGNSELVPERWRVNRNAAAVILQRERLDRADVLDNSGEHGYRE